MDDSPVSEEELTQSDSASYNGIQISMVSYLTCSLLELQVQKVGCAQINQETLPTDKQYQGCANCSMESLIKRLSNRVVSWVDRSCDIERAVRVFNFES